jgi:excisionase family DNA binding protein
MLPTIVSQPMPRNTVRRVRIAIERRRLLVLREPAPAATITAATWEAMTPAQVAKQLHVSIDTVQRWEREGLLVPARIGRLARYDIRDVQRFIATYAARNRAEIERAA